MHAPRCDARAGFSMVELIVAVIVLAVGILGFAGTTMYTVRQTTASDLQTERMAALVTIIERIRTMPWDTLDMGSGQFGTDSVGIYQVEWTTTDVGDSKDVRIITTGPGLSNGAAGGMPTIRDNVPDTFDYRVLPR